jgi:hypothetical protein
MAQMRTYLGSAMMLTLVIWLMAGITMLGPLMGDCLPEMGHSCPTDHERKINLLWIALTAAAINVTAVWLLISLRRRNGC